MVELKVQVSEDVAMQLEPYSQQLPNILQQIAQSLPNVARDVTQVGDQEKRVDVTKTSIYTEILDFLIAQPSPQEIIDFKVSAATQERLGYLLEKNREETLSSDEMAELDAFEQIDQLMALLKARAHNQLRMQANLN